MLGTIIGLILTVIVLGVVWWAFKKLIALFPLEEPFKTILDVLVVVLMVVVVIWVIIQLFHLGGINVPMFR